MTRLSTHRKSSPKRSQKGFSLLEVLLAVTIAIGLGSMQLGQLKRDTETKQAQIVGQQMRTVGNAFNAYLAQNYGSLVLMESYPAPGTAEHPGPVVCNAGTRICTITSDTLRRSGLLPASFSGRNSYGSTYNYYIRVTGPTDHWIVDGIVVTNDPYTVGGAVRHDMIGAAMLEAGADSGSTRTVANQINGYNGTWLETSYPQVNQIGLLAYRAGYGSSNNSAYLRVDGSLPMEGSLKMGNNSIENANDITANGQVKGQTFRTEGSSPEAIQLGTGVDGTPDANRTLIGNQGNRLKVANTGGLELVNPDTGTYTDLYAGNITGTGNLNISGYANVNGALRANSLSTVGAIEAGSTIRSIGLTQADGGFATDTGNYVTSNGNISAICLSNSPSDQCGRIQSRDLIVTRNANITGNTLIGRDLDVRGDLKIGSGTGSTWHYDSASNTLLTTTSTNFTANNITATGSLRTNAKGTVGGSCNQNGEIRTDNTTSQVISCDGARWIAAAPLSHTYSITGAAGRTSTAVCAANERVTGCTAVYISRGTVDDPSNAAVAQVVNSTQCTVSAPASANVTLQAVAVCAR